MTTDINKINDNVSSNNESTANTNESTIKVKVGKRKAPPHAFQPGNKYGKGRPVGCRNKATLAIEEMGEQAVVMAMDTIVKLVLAGDLNASKFIIERVSPTRKDILIYLDLPPITDAASLLQAVGEVVQLMSESEITPLECSNILGVLEYTRKFMETCELEKRLEEIEGMLKDKRPTADKGLVASNQN